MVMPDIVELEKGWAFMEIGVTKLKRILEGLPEPSFESTQYIHLYTTIYNMCTQKPPHDYSQQLYDKYRLVIDDYNKQTVLPSLWKKHDEYVLRELVERWANHKVLVKWLNRFCVYLDRYFVTRRGLPTLKEVGFNSFRDLVYHEMQSKAKDAILALIHKEREGEQIDRALLKNVLDVYVDNGMGKMDKYEEDFEIFMLEETASYYSRKASRWIQEDSCPDYMLKSEECLKKERERVSHYLHSITEPKLVEKVQNELLVEVAKRLLENEHSGCRALLRDDKMEDLSRMYRLFDPIPQGLEPVADMFKQHVTAEIKQASDAATDKGSVQDQVLIRKVIELHDKYMVYVNECFQKHSLFHKALKEALEVFCNKTVAGVSSAEILATYCDNILKKGRGRGDEKLSDEAIEATLEKVVVLLVYVSDKNLFAEFYRKKQARRLLFDRSGSDEQERSILEEQERSILSKFKELLGDQFNESHWDFENMALPYGFPPTSVRPMIGKLISLVNNAALPVIKAWVHTTDRSRLFGLNKYEELEKTDGMLMVSLDLPLKTDQDVAATNQAADIAIVEKCLDWFKTRQEQGVGGLLVLIASDKGYYRLLERIQSADGFEVVLIYDTKSFGRILLNIPYRGLVQWKKILQDYKTNNDVELSGENGDWLDQEIFDGIVLKEAKEDLDRYKLSLSRRPRDLVQDLLDQRQRAQRARKPKTDEQLAMTKAKNKRKRAKYEAKKQAKLLDCIRGTNVQEGEAGANAKLSVDKVQEETQLDEIESDGGQVEPPGMNMIYLPYANDMRDIEELHSKPGVAAPRASDDQLKKASALMRRLELKEDFSVCQFANPALQRHYAILQAIALDENKVRETRDETLPDEEGMKRPGVVKATEQFKQSIYGDDSDEESDSGAK